MPHWFFPSMFPTWPRDTSGNIVLLKLPQDLDLTPALREPGTHATRYRQSLEPRRTRVSISAADLIGQHLLQTRAGSSCPPYLPSLPTEIQYLILDYLPPVERVCLALTCKALCSVIVAAPRLGPSTWGCFLPPPALSGVDNGDDLLSYYPRLTYYWRQIPESYTLLQRLAHGWIPKAKLRYCWKCHRILSRDPEFWKKKIKGNKKPKWDIRTSCDKYEWNTMSRKRRFQHLIDVWCTASFEDSSLLCCDSCREAVYARDMGMSQQKSSPVANSGPDEGLTELQSVYIDRVDGNLTRPEPSYDPTSSSTNHRLSAVQSPSEDRFGISAICKTTQIQPHYTIECPACLEKQLTFTFSLPRRPVVRTFFRDCWSKTWKVLGNVLWVLGSVLFAVLSVAFTLIDMLCVGSWKIVVKIHTKVLTTCSR